MIHADGTEGSFVGSQMVVLGLGGRADGPLPLVVMAVDRIRRSRPRIVAGRLRVRSVELHVVVDDMTVGAVCVRVGGVMGLGLEDRAGNGCAIHRVLLLVLTGRRCGGRHGVGAGGAKDRAAAHR